MSGSVTPARRRRDDVESEEEEYEVSIDGESPSRSNGSKRARLDEDSDVEDDGDEDVSESDNNQLLPDSYLRSPKGRGRAPDGDEPKEHQPGSIVRVTLTNFVTYTNAEFHPGPNLNMIIGPNGTGKSTLVCAICIGLGWSTSHLGRAKDLGEFVKHGAKRAEIEIELARDPHRQQENPVITTGIIKEGSKAEFLIDNKKSTKKAVQALARSLSIQVDNLCQFLPQDRVVEFAALSPVDLLAQTQRATAPQEMTDWHEALKEKRKEQKQYKTEEQKAMEHLKSDENRQKLQEADVARLRERTVFQERLAALERLRPFPEYQYARKQHAEAKERKKAAEAELKRLQRRLEPNLRAVEQKQHYLERLDKVSGLRERLVQRQEGTIAVNKKKIDAMQEKIDERVNQIEVEKANVKATRQAIPRHQQNLAQIERAIASPPAPFDPADMNDQVRDKTRRMREIEAKADDIKHEIGSINEQGNQRKRIIQDAAKEMENLQSQAGQQANKLRQASRDAAKAWEWIQENKDRFQGEVFGPPIVECAVKDKRHADAVESMIPDGEKLAFTVTSHEDFKMLQQQLYGTMSLNDVNIRASLQPLSSFRAPMTAAELPRFGLQHWLLDLLEGPEPVLAMLCDNRNIHRTAFATREINEDQFNALQRSEISSWVTPKQTYMIARRREYGDQATSTRVQDVKKARFFTDVPVDRQMEDELNNKMREARDQIQDLQNRRKELMAEGTQLNEDRKKLMEEKKEIEEEKAQKQRALSDFNGLPVKRTRLQEKLNEALDLIRGYKERVRVIIDRGDELTTTKGQYCLDYANSVEAMRDLHVQLFEAEILQIEAKSDLEQLKAQHAEEQQLLEARKQEVTGLQDESRRLHTVGMRLQEKCKSLDDEGISEFEYTVREEIMDWQPDQLETEIESVQARLEMNGGGANQNVLREYEERGKKIEARRARLRELDDTLTELEAEIKEIQERWEPRLDALVAQISEAFAENFARIQCAGEVTVYKDEDFELWAIQIKVKFREHEQLSVLDSHRQSGGERAVSTIFYLMALQSLARAPFRVVDEINQGMDPRNERLVHSRMVDIACAEHTSQYFLITPKLLNGLKYHPNMKVHCIASGEFMPKDHRELDFGMLARKALSLRGVRVAG